MGARNVKRLYDNAISGGVAITPVTAGTGAVGTVGSIQPGVGIAMVTSTDANQRVNLPLNEIGTVLWIYEITDVGYELITTTVGGTINETLCDGVLAGSEMNIPVAAVPDSDGMLLHCLCVSATNWIVIAWNNRGQLESDIVQT